MGAPHGPVCCIIKRFIPGDLGLQSASEASTSSHHGADLSGPETETSHPSSAYSSPYERDDQSEQEDSDRGSKHSGSQPRPGVGSQLPRTLAIVAEAMKSRLQNHINSQVVDNEDDDSVTGKLAIIMLPLRERNEQLPYYPTMSISRLD